MKKKQNQEINIQINPKAFPLKKEIMVGVFFILSSCFVFFPSINGDFIWDDENRVRDNVHLRSLEGLKTIFLEPGSTPEYYPITYASFWVEYHLWKDSPIGYHLINILIHGLSGVLLWLILRNLKIPLAWFIAMLFTIHPIQTESVAFITERKNVLMGLFYFSSLFCWFKFQEGKKKRFFLLSIFLFLLAMLSKTTACTLPVILLLLHWWKDGKDWKSNLLNLFPFFAITAILIPLTIRIEQEVSASGPPENLLESFLIAGNAIWFYIGKILFPVNLMGIYPKWELSTTNPFLYFFPLLTLGSLVYFLKNHRKFGKGPLVGIGFFIITLLPALGFVSFDYLRLSFVADHFQYLACIGIIVLFATVFFGFFKNKKLTILIQSLILITLGSMTLVQSQHFQNAEIFFSHSLKGNPNSPAVHNNLAGAFGKRGDFGKAIHHYKESIKLAPEDGSTHYNLGTALAKSGKLNEAITHYKEALKHTPDHPRTSFNLGTAYARKGNFEKAIPFLKKATQIDPSDFKAHYNLGLAYQKLGRNELAKIEFETTLKINPNFTEAKKKLNEL